MGSPQGLTNDEPSHSDRDFVGVAVGANVDVVAANVLLQRRELGTGQRVGCELRAANTCPSQQSAAAATAHSASSRHTTPALTYSHMLEIYCKPPWVLLVSVVRNEVRAAHGDRREEQPQPWMWGAPRSATLQAGQPRANTHYVTYNSGRVGHTERDRRRVGWRSVCACRESTASGEPVSTPAIIWAGEQRRESVTRKIQ